MLHDLQLAEKTFYKLRRELRELGLLDWKQQRNRSTEYRVFTRRDWALLVPCFDNPRSVTYTDRDRYRLPTYLDLCGSTESSSAAADVLPLEPAHPNEQQQQQRKQRIKERLEDRIEALIGICAVRARELHQRYDEADDRQRLAAGEIRRRRSATSRR